MYEHSQRTAACDYTPGGPVVAQMLINHCA